jgi:hypothetical protein
MMKGFLATVIVALPFLSTMAIAQWPTSADLFNNVASLPPERDGIFCDLKEMELNLSDGVVSPDKEAHGIIEGKFAHYLSAHLLKILRADQIAIIPLRDGSVMMIPCRAHNTWHFPETVRVWIDKEFARKLKSPQTEETKKRK